jgi:subtilisin family serine protease
MKTTKRSFKQVMAFLLSCLLLVQLLPLSVLADMPQEWIAEFADSATARLYADAAEGTYLGGPFALLRVGKAELESYPILSLTENSRVEGSSVSQPSDAKASEQYILTHKSWYAQDAWASLESFLVNQPTSLTPADCDTVRVAVLDSGIDATHEDLSGRVTAGWDAINHTAIGASYRACHRALRIYALILGVLFSSLANISLNRGNVISVKSYGKSAASGAYDTGQNSFTFHINLLYLR